MNRLIIYLIRKRLGLKKNVYFRFTNQKDIGAYYFDDYYLMKVTVIGYPRQAGVSLNWLLSKDCKVEVLK